jgi:hypothetical protein
LNVISKSDIMPLRKKHRDTYDSIFAEPTLGNIEWREIENLLRALGADISEGRGSRVRIALNGRRATLHRPHPQKEASKSSVKDVRLFLRRAGYNND